MDGKLWNCGGNSPGEDVCTSFLSWGVLWLGVLPSPSPVAGVPDSVAYEVLMVASLEISGFCDAVGSEVSPSGPLHTPVPSVHRIHRQLGPPEQ